MSTLYATFLNTKAANAVVTELVRGGVRPEDISLITKQNPSYNRQKSLTETSGSVGDASFIVGRSDDPDLPDDFSAPYDEYTTLEKSPIAGVDTSDIATDVESVDQADDSQEIANESAYPYHGISNSEHTRDDINLSMETNFATDIPTIDSVPDTESRLTEDTEDQLETVIIPGFGYVVGGGDLATQALDFSGSDEAAAIGSLLSFFRSEGVPRWAAERYVRGLMDGGSILAVNVTPGELNEEAIEAIFEAHGGENTTLYDAPRYRQTGYLG